MSGQGWSGLGFDPAPGALGAVQGLVGTLDRTTKHLGETHDTLVGIRGKREVWTGRAAEAFASHLDELPKHVGNAHTSLSNVRREVSGWGERLSGYQQHAESLERQAKQARKDVAHAETEEETAKRAYPHQLEGRLFPTQAEADRASAELQAAGRRIETAVAAHQQARGNLEELIQQGMNLQDEHNTDGDAAARRIAADAEDLAPPDPSLLERFEGWTGDAVHWVEGRAKDTLHGLEQVGNWFKDHLQDIGNIASIISAVSAALALTPLASIAAPLAVASGAVALAAHSTKIGLDVSHGEHFTVDDGFTLAADVACIIPGIGALKGGLKGASRGAEEAAVAGDEALRTVSGLSQFGKGASEGLQSMMKSPTDLAKKFGGLLTHSASESHAAEMAARIAEGTFDAGTAVPTAVGQATGQDHVSGQDAVVGSGTVYGTYGGIEGLAKLIKAR